MGYSLHITPKKGNEISLEEWLDYIESDPEFSVTTEDYLTGVNPVTGKEIRIKSDSTTGNWNNNGDVIPFTFSEEYGIDVKSPNDDIILKMLDIANHFNALLLGDDREEYNVLYFSNRDEWLKEWYPSAYKAKMDRIEKNYRAKKPWWKFW